MPKKIPRKLKAFYKSVKLTSDRGRALWNSCRQAGNVFDPALKPEPLGPSPQQALPGLMPLSDSTPERPHYLPIEHLKGPLGERIGGCIPKVSKEFRSSGTTQADRARSPFSDEGLQLYRGTSVRAFYDMLANLQSLPPIKLRAVSLVPSPAEWPDSSLAQMISWLGDLWGKIHYLKPEELPKFVKSHRRRPYFVFGTALHWLAVLEEGRRLRMPAGSVIIETGGLKSSGLQFTREDLYVMLSTALKIPESSIVSEYGMSEMASQAYDWQVTHFGKRSPPRAFQFPFWVNAGVMRGMGKIDPAGDGALVIEDSMRLDLPVPLRTQDLATIESSKRFTLQGRVPYAVLKGCSMNASELLENRVPGKGPAKNLNPLAAKLVAETRKTRQWEWQSTAVTKRAQQLMTMMEQVTKAKESLIALTAELGSSHAAESALADLGASLPRTLEQWVAATENAVGLDRSSANVPVPNHWLIIPPANHSLAALYPILLGLTAGMKLTVRRQNQIRLGFLHNFLEACQSQKQAGLIGLELLTNSFRFGTTGQTPPDFEAAMLYGSDATLTALADEIHVPIKRFGTSLCLAVGQLPLSPELARAIVKDAFSLGQRGCLSSRGLVLLSEDPIPDLRPMAIHLTNLLSEAFQKFWQNELPWKDQVALDHETVESTNRNVLTFRADHRAPLFPVYHPETLATYDLRLALSERPFVLPIVIVSKKDLAKLKQSLAAIQELRTLVLGPDVVDLFPNFASTTCRTVPCGFANVVKWDGMFESHKLFVISPK